jgi:hypothetical protein
LREDDGVDFNVMKLKRRPWGRLAANVEVSALFRLLAATLLHSSERGWLTIEPD